MRLLRLLRPAATWGRVTLFTSLRGGAFASAALIAVTLVLAGRGFDLLSFTPDAARAAGIGIQTGALVGVLWAVRCPSGVAAVREADDGASAALRSSAAGVSGLWWGAWGAQIALAWGLLALSVLSTSVLSILIGLPVALSLSTITTAALSVLLAALAASAGTAWGGSIVGALVGVGAWAAGQAGAAVGIRAFGAPAVGGALPATEVLRTVALGLGAIAVALAGLRRLRL